MLQTALEIDERIGNEPGVARRYATLANVYQRLGNMGQALACHHQALKSFERIGDQYYVALTYFNLGNLHREQGDREQARTHFEKAKAMFEMVGDTRNAQRAARILRHL